jgi:hypothetical protein
MNARRCRLRPDGARTLRTLPWMRRFRAALFSIRISQSIQSRICRQTPSRAVEGSSLSTNRSDNISTSWHPSSPLLIAESTCWSPSLTFPQEMQHGLQVIPERNGFSPGWDYGSMKLTLTLVLGFAGLGIATAKEVAPRHEIGLTLGGLFGSQRSGGATRLDLGSGVALAGELRISLAGQRNGGLVRRGSLPRQPFS